MMRAVVPIAVLLAASLAPRSAGAEIDLAAVSASERANGQREQSMAMAAYDPAGLLIDRWLFPVREKIHTISTPPGLSYRDLATRQTREDIYGVVYYPHDWMADDHRPVTVYAYGSGWNGLRTGRPQVGAEEAAYLSRQGMVVVSTHYRSGLAESMADAVSAVRWTRARARELGIAPDRVTGGGGSSGGHIMLSTTVIVDGPENPWDDRSIPKACQYHFGQVGVPSRPETPARSPAHQLRNGLPPYLQIIGTADKNWGRFAYEFKERAAGTDLPFWFMEYEGVGHGWLGPGMYQVKGQTLDFLHTYGALDVLHYGLPGARVDLGGMAELFTGQGLPPGMSLRVDGGGVIQGMQFVDDGQPGRSVVTATSTADPRIVRHAYIHIGRQLWADAAEQAGAWSRRDYQGRALFTSADEAAQLRFRVDLPAGDWMAYAVRWKDPYHVHNATRIRIQGAGAETEAVVDLSKQKAHLHVPLAGFRTTEAGTVGLEISRAPWDTKDKPGNRPMDIALWGLVVLPRYTGGHSNLPYKRGHLRHKTFKLHVAVDGDEAIGP